MSSSRNKQSPLWMLAVLVALAVGMLAGCIADTAEDTDLPWARNQGWEGMIPLPSGVADRYD